MRMINYPLDEHDQELIESATQYAENLWIVPKHCYEDIVAVLKAGYEHVWRHLVPFDALYSGAKDEYVANKQIRGKATFHSILSQLFDSRRDIVEFAQGDLIRDLYHDTSMEYDDKVRVLLQGMEVVLDSILNPQSGGKGGAPSQSPYKAYGDMLESLAPPRPKSEEGGESQHSGRMKEEVNEMYRASRSASYADTLKKLIRKVYDTGKQALFTLAANFDYTLQHKDGSQLKEAFIGNTVKTRRMRGMADLKNLRPIDLTYDQAQFDAQLARKSFRIEQPMERYQKNQLIYVLADSSGSMDCRLREQFMKAVVISLGRNAIENNGHLYLRWFTSSPSPLYKISTRDHWYGFLERVVDKSMNGGTNLHSALFQASDDIQNSSEVVDETEIVLVTDGTESANPEEIAERVKVPCHVILLEEPAAHVLEGYKECFKSVTLVHADTLESALEGGIEFLKK